MTLRAIEMGIYARNQGRNDSGAHPIVLDIPARKLGKVRYLLSLL